MKKYKEPKAQHWIVLRLVKQSFKDHGGHSRNTGWSGRFGMWIAESLEAKSKAVAKERFLSKYPTLKKIKLYKLRGEA